MVLGVKHVPCCGNVFWYSVCLTYKEHMMYIFVLFIKFYVGDSLICNFPVTESQQMYLENVWLPYCNRPFHSSWFLTFAVLWMYYYSFAWLHSVWIFCANFAEHSVCSIFIGRLNNKNNWDKIARVFIQVKVWLKRSLGQSKGQGIGR